MSPLSSKPIPQFYLDLFRHINTKALEHSLKNIGTVGGCEGFDTPSYPTNLWPAAPQSVTERYPYFSLPIKSFTIGLFAVFCRVWMFGGFEPYPACNSIERLMIKYLGFEGFDDPLSAKSIIQFLEAF